MFFRGAVGILELAQLQTKRGTVTLYDSTLLTFWDTTIVTGAAAGKVRFWKVLGLAILGGLAKQVDRAGVTVQLQLFVAFWYSHLAPAEV